MGTVLYLKKTTKQPMFYLDRTAKLYCLHSSCLLLEYSCFSQFIIWRVLRRNSDSTLAQNHPCTSLYLHGLQNGSISLIAATLKSDNWTCLNSAGAHAELLDVTRAAHHLTDFPCQSVCRSGSEYTMIQLRDSVCSEYPEWRCAYIVPLHSVTALKD